MRKIFLILLGLIVVTSGYFFFKNYLTMDKSGVISRRKASQEDVLKNVDRSKTVVVWAWNTAAKSLNELIPAFNEQYPDINVIVQEFTYEEAQDKFRSAVTSKGDVPDVWDSEGPVTAHYVKLGALTDITDKAQPLMKDFVAYKAGEVTVDKKIYALPWDSAPVAVFYRRDLFEAAGVDANSIQTWDDFIAAGKKVTKDTDGDGKVDQYMTFLSPREDVQDTFEVLIQQSGGSLYDAQGNPTFNSASGVRAVETMKKILKSGIAADIGWWSPQFFDSMKNGNVATYTQGVWLGGQIKEFAPGTSGKWGVMPLPALNTGGIRSAVNGGSNLAIPVGARNPDGAWKFIEFALARKESQLLMYESYNIFPALTSTYTDQTFLQPNSFFGDQVTSELFIDTQKRLPANWYYGPYYNETTRIVSKEIVEALNDRKSSQQALNDAAREVNALIKGQ